jgi:hypothetical protein
MTPDDSGRRLMYDVGVGSGSDAVRRGMRDAAARRRVGVYAVGVVFAAVIVAITSGRFWLWAVLAVGLASSFVILLRELSIARHEAPKRNSS